MYEDVYQTFIEKEAKDTAYGHESFGNDKRGSDYNIYHQLFVPSLHETEAITDNNQMLGRVKFYCKMSNDSLIQLKRFAKLDKNRPSYKPNWNANGLRVTRIDQNLSSHQRTDAALP
ncbi:uncharacterized protein LOC144640411 [Oculina patagonica]